MLVIYSETAGATSLIVPAGLIVGTGPTGDMAIQAPKEQGEPEAL